MCFFENIIKVLRKLLYLVRVVKNMKLETASWATAIPHAEIRFCITNLVKRKKIFKKL